MPELSIKVTGMMCGGCTGGCEKVVGKIAGVNSVKAEHDPASKVTVDMDEGTDVDSIKAR